MSTKAKAIGNGIWLIALAVAFGIGYAGPDDGADARTGGGTPVEQRGGDTFANTSERPPKIIEFAPPEEELTTHRQIADALDEALAQPSQWRREDAVRGIAERLDAEGAATLAGMAESARTDAAHRAILQPALGRWTELAPEDAARFSTGLEGAPWALPEVVRVWATTDPGAAILWLEGQETAIPEQALSAAKRQAYAAWAVLDPMEAARAALADPAFAGDTLTGEPDASLGKALVQPLLLQGAYEQALQMARELPGGAQLAAENEIVQQWSAFQPAEALEYALAIPELSARRSALDAVVSNWGAVAPQSAAEALLETLPTGDRIRTLYLATLLKDWSRRDARAAANWLATAPEDADLDEGKRLVAQSLADSEPRAAIELARTIESSSSRQTALFRVAREWMETEPEAARTFIENSELPDLNKNQLLNR